MKERKRYLQHLGGGLITPGTKIRTYFIIFFLCEDVFLRLQTMGHKEIISNLINREVQKKNNTTNTIVLYVQVERYYLNMSNWYHYF